MKDHGRVEVSLFLSLLTDILKGLEGVRSADATKPASSPQTMTALKYTE